MWDKYGNLNQKWKIRGKLKMKNLATKVLSLCVSVTTLSAALLLPGNTTNAAAAGSTYTESKTYFFNNTNCGYYTEPTADGTYKTVILMHGNGTTCSSWMAQQMPKAMEAWTQAGYLDPMNIIMPWISYKDGNDSCGVMGHRDFAVNYTDDLGYNIENITCKADTSKYTTAIAGYSMGGCDALTAAALYPELYHEVGSLSSSFTFYKWDDPNNDWSTFHSPDEMNFASDLDAYITYGNVEWQHNANDHLFKYSGDHYYKLLTNTFGYKNTQFHECMNQSWGSHGNKLFFREIFMYLYYLQHGELPSEELTEKACGNVFISSWKTLAKPTTHNPSKKNQSTTPLTVSDTVSTKTNVTYGESYTVSVTAKGGDSSKYTYDWQYSVYEDKNFTSTTRTDKNGKSLNGNSSLTIADATRDIYYRCKVSDGKTTVYSKPVRINVAAKIKSISSDGYGVSLKPNATYKITVEAEGLELSYMWEYSCDGGSTWVKSTNPGYNTKTATYVNREENHVQVIYYRCTVKSAGTSKTVTIKLGK